MPNFYFWNENRQKDSWQTIHPREYFVSPREGNETTDVCSRRCRLQMKTRDPSGRLQILSATSGAQASPHPTLRLAILERGAGYSRTLYTSKALDQSDIIG